MTTKTKKTTRSTKDTYEPRPPNCRRYLVIATVVCPVDIPTEIASTQFDIGMLDHEICERFERKYRDGIPLVRITQTEYSAESGFHPWTPVYRQPRAEQFNAQDERRAWRAFISGCTEVESEPTPPSTLY